MSLKTNEDLRNAPPLLWFKIRDGVDAVFYMLICVISVSTYQNVK